MSVDDLARNYISTRRNGYIEQAWQKFSGRDYRAAGDLFELADSLALDNPSARADIELGKMFSAFASSQYALAGNALRFLVAPYRQTSEPPDPRFLDRLPGLLAHYADQADFQEQLNNLEAMVIANPLPPPAAKPDPRAVSAVIELHALRSVMLWAKQDSRAAFYAGSFSTSVTAFALPEYGPWNGLASLMEQATRRGSHETNATPSQDAPASPLLPPDPTLRP